MSELNRFARKPYEKEIEGKVWKFRALGVNELPIFLSMQNTEDANKLSEGIKNILKIYINDNISDATDEEVSALPMDFIMAFMDAVYIANGLNNESRTELIKKVENTKNAQ